jgi:hypothetical protein
MAEMSNLQIVEKRRGRRLQEITDKENMSDFKRRTIPEKPKMLREKPSF